jgi:hypothetical protein
MIRTRTAKRARKRLDSNDVSTRAYKCQPHVGKREENARKTQRPIRSLEGWRGGKGEIARVRGGGPRENVSRKL